MALNNIGNEVIFICPEPEAMPLPYARVIPVRGRKKGTWTYFDFWYSAAQVKAILDFEKPDDIHALHLTPFGVWGRLAGCRPLTVMALGADVFEYTGPSVLSNGWNAESQKQGLSKWVSFVWHRWQVKKTLKQAEYIFADNASLVQGIQLLVPTVSEKVKQFTWGIELEKWTFQDESQKRQIRIKHHLPEFATIILCPRGLKPIYQPEVILDAIRLSVSNSNIFWILCKGNYDIPSAIQAEIHAMDSSNFAFIEETVSEEVMREYFALSDALVSIPVYDGLSASVLQGLASGLYPILSDIPGNREFLKQGVALSLLKEINGQNLLDNVVTWSTVSKTSGKKSILERNRNWVKENGNITSQIHNFETIRYS
jgi:glycosyltransferase involved in cell wall biosynthesis